MDVQKKKLQEENKGLLIADQKYVVEDYKEFQRKMKLMNEKSETPKLKALDNPEVKKEAPKRPEVKRPGPKKEQKKEEVKRSAPSSPGQTPEQILGLKPNEPFTKEELKKRYFELLKQNHPDRVAAMGEDFKTLAEKNTKEINRAYNKLKNRAA